MASVPKAREQDHHPNASRIHSALENILPASLHDMQKCAGDFPKESKLMSSPRSRPSTTPLSSVSRPVSMMSDSFMLEHWGPSSHNSPRPSHDGERAENSLPKEEETPAVIANWAHLSYIKAQRSTLRTELKAHQVAGAEAKRSVASLRRLAFRMAVNISVKEKQIATAARNLAKSRTSNYLDGKDAQKRVEQLQRALRVEEGRNKEILEALERASMLTLQCNAKGSTPKEKSTHRPERSSLSPPPSPPARSSIPDSPLSSPRTPTRPAPSPWHDVDLELTPRLASPSEIRTSDSRLIRAKRESDQALAACRSRIEQLQRECAESKEDGRLLAATRVGLEQEIRDHQSRIAALERSRAAMSENLEATKLQLHEATGSEERLLQELQELQDKIGELAVWEQKAGELQHIVDALQKEKIDLEERLQTQNAQVRELQIRTTTLEETVYSLRNKLEIAERHESSLRDRLSDKEHACQDLRKRLDRGLTHIQHLEQKITTHDAQAVEHLRKIEVGGNVISTIREQLRDSQIMSKNAQEASVALKGELQLLQEKLQHETDARARLATELEELQIRKVAIEHELRTTSEARAQETEMKAKLESELGNLRTSHTTTETKLQQALERVQSLEAADGVAGTRFKSLQDEKATLEASLKDVRLTLLTLRGEIQTKDNELAEVHSTSANLEEKLRASEEQVSSFGKELEQMRVSKQEDNARHAAEMQKSEQHLCELEASMLNIRSVLASSEKLEASLREELDLVRGSKSTVEGELGEARRSRAELESKVDDVHSRLSSTQSDRDSLMVRISELESDLTGIFQSKSSLDERLAATTTESSALKDRIAVLEASLKATQDAKAKTEEALAAVQQDGKVSDANVVDLRKRAHETETARSELQRELDEATSSKLDLQSQLHSAQDSLAAVESEAKHVQTQLSDLRNETEKLQQSKLQAEEHIKALEASHSDLKEELQNMRSHLSDAESKVSQLETKLAFNEEELEAMCRAKTAIEKRLKQTHDDNARLDEELRLARESNEAIKYRFASTTVMNERLEKDLTAARSRMDEAGAHNVELESRLSDAEKEVERLRQLKGEVEGRLNEALATSASTEQSLTSTRSRLDELESRNSSILQELTESKEELNALRQARLELQGKLDGSEEHVGSLQEQMSSMQSRIAELDTGNANLASELAMSGKDLKDLRLEHANLEESSQTAYHLSSEIEIELRAARMRLDIAESESLEAIHKLLATEKELTSARDANVNLETSEQELLTRLASAEEELDTARQKNAHLEAFLERMESDMANAHSAVEDAERRYQELVGSSDAKLDAATTSKLRYKRRLSEKINELGILITENSDLHEKIGIQTREMGALKKGKGRLVEELSKKEKYIEDLGSSTDGRIRSMNSAYNGLRKKFEEQQQQHKLLGNSHGSAARLEAELDRKMTEIEELHQDQEAHAASFAALEREVEALRNDKRAFEKLISTLQEKIRHLEVLEEWEEPSDTNRSGSPRHITIQDGPYDTAPSSPMSSHARSSIGYVSVQLERPQTRASTIDRDEDLDLWARHVEQVRIQRDEAVVQLKGMKKSQHNLKKTLRNTDAQLHRGLPFTTDKHQQQEAPEPSTEEEPPYDFDSSYPGPRLRVILAAYGRLIPTNSFVARLLLFASFHQHTPFRDSGASAYAMDA
ncbi:hypothetical protein DDE83_007010 [Stemphylium lycopersici]|uniref:Uncharacterized protein n=1 Tax=Stemphylium lycopersici TaxID=183478 RepID=A0A364MXA8_STELY|nr:hypothetical protein DDE83_007010 [Stemphylium lycopersici]